MLEVGSLNVNGSIRPMIESRGPRSYLGVDVLDGPGVDRVVDAVSFKSMKANGEEILGDAQVFWEQGAKTFMNKGTNGRWRDVLDDNDLAAYEAMKKRSMSPDCADWLELGRRALAGAANP